MPATFQHIQETIYITFYISIRVLYGITHSCLSSQVYNLVKMLIGKKHLHSLSVFQIHTDKPKMLIAAYHRSEDLFALPQLVFSIRSDYQLYLRHHRQLPAWDVNFYFV